MHWTAFLKKYGITQKDFSEDIAHSTVLEMKKNGMDNEANGMIKHFAESGHPIFRGRSALNRGILRRKVGRNAIHFTAESVNIELFFAHVTRHISLVRRPWEWTNPFQK